MSKNYATFIKPNKVNLILMLVGYALFRIFDVLFFGPLYEFYVPITEGSAPPYPLELSILQLTFNLVTFYLIGSFAYWLANYFKSETVSKD